jgi:hypothetical protein
MRDWTALFVSGQPLFEVVPMDSGEPTPEQVLEEERQKLLDEGDFMEYKVSKRPRQEAKFKVMRRMGFRMNVWFIS